MNLSASDVQRTRFRGTRHAYDRREVDTFLERVVATLASHETALAGANRELAAMKKTLQQLTAARDAARRRPEIRPAFVEDGPRPQETADAAAPVHAEDGLELSADVPPESDEDREDTVSGDVAADESSDQPEPDDDRAVDGDRERLDWLLQWIAAQEASAAAVEIIAGAHEERRMIASIAQELRRDLLEEAEREAVAASAKAATAAKRKATRLVNKAQKEAEQARAEAEQARADAEQTQAAAEQTRVEVEQSRVETELEVDEMKQRLSRLQESLAEAKDRIGHLSDATATDVAAIGELVALDSGPPGSGAEPGHVTVVVEGADAAADELRERLASLRRQLDDD